MAEETAQERTENATPKRLLKAHEEGQVPRSTELSAAVVVLAGATGLAFIGGSSIGHGAEGFLRDTMRQLVSSPFSQADAVSVLRNITRVTIPALGPFMLAILVPVVLVNAIQARGVLSLKPVSPDFSRVNPGAGLKRLLSSQSLVTLLK